MPTDAAASAMASAPAPATPTRVQAPEPHENCTAEIQESVQEGQTPDRITISCGSQQRTALGDFSNRTVNYYANDTGIEKILVISGEIRAWLRTEEDTCLLTYRPGEDPASCTTTPQPAATGEGHTVAPKAPDTHTP